MGIVEDIKRTLTETFSPAHLEVTDETGTGQKFLIVIVSEKFAGKTTLANHRSVQSALSPLMPSIHAITIQAYDTVKWGQHLSNN